MLQPQPFQVKFHRFLHVFFYLLFGLSSCNATIDIRRVSRKSRFRFLNND